MDLIYTDINREDEGILSAYELDLAFGSGENDFELKAGTQSMLTFGQYIYIEGTEYGGIIDAIESDTATKEIVYSGRSWHGILNSKVITPPAGADYLVLNGDANTVLGGLITSLGLGSLFEADADSAGIAVQSYQMPRYIPAYNGILKMLKDSGAKLTMQYTGDKVKLAAKPIIDYTTTDDEFVSDILEFRAKKTVNKVNHLICLGQGELAERTVIHLFADADGNISTMQTITEADEFTAIYENTGCETAEKLQSEGTKRFKELLDQDDIQIDFNEVEDSYEVGDIVGAIDNVTGIAVKTEIKKKIVKIKDGRITVDLDTTSGASKVSHGGDFNGEQLQGGDSGVNPEAVFPIGSIYMTASDVNPAVLFGFGTWERLKDRLLMAAGDIYAAGSTGGSATHKHTTAAHTLTVSEMPAHEHTAKGWAAVVDGSGTYITLGGQGASPIYSTNKTGGNQPHSHGDTSMTSSLGPYKAYYVWERIV